MDEFGMGSFNLHSAAGHVVVPTVADHTGAAKSETPALRVSGGSSGGSAAAVASPLHGWLALLYLFGSGWQGETTHARA